MSCVKSCPITVRFRMSDIRADQKQYCHMKALFERILGHTSFMRVKDYAPLRVWKAESRKLIKAVELSIETTVQVVDDEWKEEVRLLLEYGLSLIDLSDSIDELFASLAATLGELSFLQIGYVPKGHSREDRIPLIAPNWKLDRVRTVQYVQSPKQRAEQAQTEKMKISNGNPKPSSTVR